MKMNGRLCKQPPQKWEDLTIHAGQSVEYANAMRGLGYQPFYYQNEQEAALVQIRGGKYPMINRVISRAYVYPSNISQTAFEDVLNVLKVMNIPFAKIGNNFWGVENRELFNNVPHCNVVDRYTFAIDLSNDEEYIWKKFQSVVRQNIRKGEKEGVRITEITEKKNLPLFYEPYYLTSSKLRDSKPYTIFPLSVFESLLDNSKNKFARFFIAVWEGNVIASRVVICSHDRMMEFQSGVNRKYRDKQGSTALHWHCIRLAQKEGYKLYDFGGCTPGLDRSDDRYNVYSYKKNFSGELVKFYTAEIILNEKIKEWQDKYLSKAWDTIHPYYYKIARLFK